MKISKICRKPYFNPIIAAWANQRINECVCECVDGDGTDFQLHLKFPVWIYGIQKTCHRTFTNGAHGWNKKKKNNSCISHCNCKLHSIHIYYYVCLFEIFIPSSISQCVMRVWNGTLALSTVPCSSLLLLCKFIEMRVGSFKPFHWNE